MESFLRKKLSAPGSEEGNSARSEERQADRWKQKRKEADMRRQGERKNKRERERERGGRDEKEKERDRSFTIETRSLVEDVLRVGGRLR